MGIDHVSYLSRQLKEGGNMLVPLCAALKVSALDMCSFSVSVTRLMFAHVSFETLSLALSWQPKAVVREP
jgi:hypothetical protein